MALFAVLGGSTASAAVLRNFVLNITTALGLALTCWTFFVLANNSNGRPVDRNTCDCKCWDTRFKNGYDATGYRSIYFNIDERMPALIGWCVLNFQLALSGIRTVINTLLSGQVRWSFMFLFLLSLYPFHFGFWATFNYLNEAYHSMLFTQTFFTIGEIMAAAIIIAYCNKAVRPHPLGLWSLICIAMTHVYQNRMDQANPLLGIRLLMYSDILYITVAAVHLYRMLNTDCVCAVSLMRSPALLRQWLLQGDDCKQAHDGGSTCAASTAASRGLDNHVSYDVELQGSSKAGAVATQATPPSSTATAVQLPTIKYTSTMALRDMFLALAGSFVATRIVAVL